MGVKICFYPSIIDENNREIDILKKQEETKEKSHCIYDIKAGEICSEFIAKYFFKPGNAPEKFVDIITKENASKEEEEKTKEEILKNIYKVKIDDMLKDSQKGIELQTYQESSKVRERLLYKYNEIDKKIKHAKIDIYALLTVEELN